MSRIGRTCSVPTEACAYQVPRVPCFSNTCVRRSVYSARCSSGTAQSSMKETGLPSPFIDIMMLRPALRTSQSAFCCVASVISTTLPGRPRSAISWTSSFNFDFCGDSIFAGKFDQQDRIRIALDERVHGLAERGDVAREADHGAVHQFDRRRPELDDVLRQVHRGVELREMHHAKRSRRRQRRELEQQLLGPGERALGADQQVRGVGVRRAEVIEVVAGDLAQHLGKARLDFASFPSRRGLSAVRRIRDIRAARTDFPSARNASAFLRR